MYSRLLSHVSRGGGGKGGVLGVGSGGSHALESPVPSTLSSRPATGLPGQGVAPSTSGGSSCVQEGAASRPPSPGGESPSHLPCTTGCFPVLHSHTSTHVCTLTLAPLYAPEVPGDTPQDWTVSF